MVSLAYKTAYSNDVSNTVIAEILVFPYNEITSVEYCKLISSVLINLQILFSILNKNQLGFAASLASQPTLNDTFKR